MTNQDYVRTSDRAPTALVVVLSLFLAAITAVVFSPGLEGEFVYDDVVLVDEAPATQSIPAAIENWMEPFLGFDTPEGEIDRGLWRPMTSLTLAIGRLVGGGDPFGFHLVSLLLHIAAVVACYRLAAALLKRRILSPLRVEGAAAMVALLFAIHPAQVESVTWISAVNDPLWGALGLCALWRYEVATENEQPPLLASLLFFLALMSKEQAVAILPLAILMDFSAGRVPRFFQFIVMLAPLITWYVLRVFVFDGTDAGIFRDHGDFQMTAERDRSFRLELAGGFLRHTFWPFSPAVFRPVHPELPAGSTAALMGTIWTGLALFAVVLLWTRKQATAAFGLLVTLVVVAPVLAEPASAGLFPLSDRYLYVGVFGAALAITSVLAKLPTLLPLLTVGMLAPAVMWPFTWNHQSRFTNELVFRFEAVEQDAPHVPYVRWGAGKAYLEEYRRTLDINDLNEATLHFLHSLKEGTTYGDGSFVDDTGLPYDKRIALLEQLIMDTPAEKRRPDRTVFWLPFDRLQATIGLITCYTDREATEQNADFAFALAMAQQTKLLWTDYAPLETTIAQIHLRRGELTEAKEAAGRAMRLDPGSLTNYAILSKVLVIEGDLEGARTTLQRATEIAPQDDSVRIDLARVAIDGERYDLAERELDVVLGRTSPENVTALVMRAELDIRRGLPREAMQRLDRALELDEGYGQAHKQRGLAAAALGDVDGAIEGFARACELMPEDFQSHYNFAALMLGQQPPADAPRETTIAWQNVVKDALIRAYVLSPRTGEEQLLLQRQIEPFLGGSPDAAFTLATTLHKQGRDVLALYWLQRVVEWRDRWDEAERSDNLVDAFTTMGTLYLRAGNPDDALEAFRSAVLTNPNDFRGRFELGLLLFDMGELQASKPHLEKALELFPEADVAPEMQRAVRGTLEQRLEQVRAADAAGPMPDSPRDAGAGTDDG